MQNIFRLLLNQIINWISIRVKNNKFKTWVKRAKYKLPDLNMVQCVKFEIPCGISNTRIIEKLIESVIFQIEL